MAAIKDKYGSEEPLRTRGYGNQYGTGIAGEGAVTTAKTHIIFISLYVVTSITVPLHCSITEQTPGRTNATYGYRAGRIVLVPRACTVRPKQDCCGLAHACCASDPAAAFCVLAPALPQTPWRCQDFLSMN